MGCYYPNCDCEVAFSEGYKPSDVTECPKCTFELAWDILLDRVLKAPGETDVEFAKRAAPPGVQLGERLRGDVDLSDLSRSYPFLDLSRKLGVPYGDILRVADVLDFGIDQGHSGFTTVPTSMLGLSRLAEAVLAICRAPWRWQYPPQGRGL